ncbi:hypothetical protein ZYGR_0A00760 [Zygosaccharomyces rouxii]|uniref:Vacuolar membrane protein ZYRO0A01628g n=2 Tax=Zygosaccharomyces rouxii TaxID=4956 RepID=YNF8_ZYGRC|nr:uncharacterized protein ZYRO0A01628g [Zygosaccharomyces rouxii]C5DPA1.1 RecName: Full=Vacuolar membrane protein ZYRO0A01628g [Zygosaccharomyces rouxii CBS 732]KAH9198968.1 vacuolar membrane protein [Zygosaccharomyces rouxii]GAV46484.1 hypothetical protein ZYGR_0A00760 [Zygosaccharomyces rouxii]CAR25512.1 ZYRO0A01628p [Zygosaccharomyces rouxii]
MAGHTVVQRALPNIASGSFAQSASKTSSHTSKTSYSAVVTPPSSDGNPNVWRANHLPDGLIYIIVGGTAAAIFAFIILWYAVARYMSRRVAKKTMYETNIQWRDTPSSGLYDHGDEKELYQSLVDHSDKNDARPKKSLIGLLGGGNGLGSSTSYDTVADADMDDDLIGGGYQERFNPVQDFVPSHFPRSSLFISPTLEVAQQNQQSKSVGRTNHFQNLSVTSLPSASESSSNLLDRPERTASPERKPKAYGRYHQRNRSSVGVSDHSHSRSHSRSKSASSFEMPNVNNNNKKHGTTPSRFLNNLLEGNDDGTT